MDINSDRMQYGGGWTMGVTVYNAKLLNSGSDRREDRWTLSLAMWNAEVDRH